MVRKIIFLSAIMALSLSLPAQTISNPQEDFLDAEYFFMRESYADALPLYLNLYEMFPDNYNLAFRIGACYLHTPGKKNLSIEYLETAAKSLSAIHREGTLNQKAAPYEALYDLGKAYRINYRFEKAIEAYEKYFETLLPDDTENINFIKNEIRICRNARELMSRPVSFREENMGPLFNTENEDFNPVISADGKSFAYMVAMKFYDAIMFSRLIGGKWSLPVNITPELQSDGNHFISCLSADGKQLFLSKHENDNSDIYVSTYDGNRWGRCVRLNRNINTRYWESHAFISEDGTKLIFASDRPGGFGGLDLYISHKQGGDWGPPVNLGPEINTEFNEDRPFLVNNGKTLFFSSQGHDNTGGYDIFRSDLQPNTLWSKPQNLGYPINNPDDNFFFMPVGDGSSGYYSIYKEFAGSGGEDIYKITFSVK